MGYITVLSEFEEETSEKKSRFISTLMPITSEEDAKELWQKMKKEHHQANHHCYAYRLRGSQLIERYSDDGEPQGTAGMPMLEVLRGTGLENVMVIVTRYFGGVKLGTGGLVRAYTSGVQKVLQTAELVEVVKVTPVQVKVAYALSGKLQHYFLEEEIYIEETNYKDSVSFGVLVEIDQTDQVLSDLIELTYDQGDVTRYDPVDGYKINQQIKRLE